MKFSQIKKGTRQVKTVPLPVLLDPSQPREEVQVGLRCLSGSDSTEVLESTAEFARERGSKNPQAGDPLYELGLRVYTLLFACVDPDNPDPESEGARFFSSVDEILEKGQGGSPILGRDGISYLFEAQEAWQDHCAPQISKLSEEEAWQKIKEVAASEDPLVFANMQPALQWNLARFMAERLLIFQRSKSVSGYTAGRNTATTKRGSKKKPSKTSRGK